MRHAIIHLREEYRRLVEAEKEIQAEYRSHLPAAWRRQLNQNRDEQRETSEALEFLLHHFGPV